MLLDVLDLFRTVHQPMPLQYVVTFVAVALNQGENVGEYARKLGIGPDLMARHLLDIGEEQSLGLITFRPNPLDER